MSVINVAMMFDAWATVWNVWWLCKKKTATVICILFIQSKAKLKAISKRILWNPFHIYKRIHQTKVCVVECAFSSNLCPWHFLHFHIPYNWILLHLYRERSILFRNRTEWNSKISCKTVYPTTFWHSRQNNVFQTRFSKINLLLLV